jgi:vesicle coat complex subunit
MAATAAWTIVHRDDAGTDHSNDIPALRNALEKGNDDTKIQTMQKILIIMLNGDSLPGLLMHVIRFVGFPTRHSLSFSFFIFGAREDGG